MRTDDLEKACGRDSTMRRSLEVLHKGDELPPVGNAGMLAGSRSPTFRAGRSRCNELSKARP